MITPGIFCPACNAEAARYLGQLGRRLHYKCTACGWLFSKAVNV